jgi:hypothetical protein
MPAVLYRTLPKTGGPGVNRTLVNRLRVGDSATELQALGATPGNRTQVYCLPSSHSATELGRRIGSEGGTRTHGIHFVGVAFWPLNYPATALLVVPYPMTIRAPNIALEYFLKKLQQGSGTPNHLRDPVNLYIFFFMVKIKGRAVPVVTAITAAEEQFVRSNNPLRPLNPACLTFPYLGSPVQGTGIQVSVALILPHCVTVWHKPAAERIRKQQPSVNRKWCLPTESNCGNRLFRPGLYH